MRADLPILCIAQPDDDESRIVGQFDAGIQVTQGDVEGVVSAIERPRSDPDLVAEQGNNARTAFEAYFTKDQAIDQYDDLLVDDERMTDGHSRGC